jgi:hypothetical protein
MAFAGSTLIAASEVARYLTERRTQQIAENVDNMKKKQQDGSESGQENKTKESVNGEDEEENE